MHGKEILKIIILLYTSVIITSGFTLSTNSRHRLFAKPGGAVSSDGLSRKTRTTLAAGGGGVEEELEVVTSKFESDTNSQKSSASSPQAKNLVRNVEVEQKWRDAEIAANTQFDLTNLSSLFILIPGILLLNDFFHFLPKEWSII